MKNKIVTSFALLLLAICSCSKDEDNNASSSNSNNLRVSSVNNNVAFFPSVTIGSQVWMTRNLEVTTYRDGTPIPGVPNPSSWQQLTTGAWCYYENVGANGTTYGKIYNWYAVAGIYDAASLANPALRKTLAPSGWHIPSNTEWAYLVNILGGQNVAGGKMKETGTLHWFSPNINATNSSGFTGLPGGGRTSGGYYDWLRNSSAFWSSTELDANQAWYLTLWYNDAKAPMSSVFKDYGWSVRCIRD